MGSERNGSALGWAAAGLIAVGLAAAACGPEKRTLNCTVCNRTEGRICVTLGSETTIVNRGDCTVFSKSTAEDCLDLAAAVQDDAAVSGCGVSKGERCVKDGETWNVY